MVLLVKWIWLILDVIFTFACSAPPSSVGCSSCAFPAEVGLQRQDVRDANLAVAVEVVSLPVEAVAVGGVEHRLKAEDIGDGDAAAVVEVRPPGRVEGSPGAVVEWVGADEGFYDVREPVVIVVGVVAVVDAVAVGVRFFVDEGVAVVVDAITALLGRVTGDGAGDALGR